MIQTLLGQKIGQTQTFTEDGKRIPVTTIAVGSCWISQVTPMNDKTQIQLAFGNRKHMKKPQVGHLKKAGITEKPRFFRSLTVDALEEEEKLGSKVLVERIFTAGDKIRVIGTSKGKGFAGVVKRHGFAGGPKTHGQSDRERAPGSIGQTTTPGRVYRGKRMAGRMGGETVSVRGLSVVSVDGQNNVLTVKGLVPGGKNGLLLIQKDSR